MRVDANGVGIEYEVTGEGPPVVLLHGFPDSGRLWRHQVPALVEAGFSTIVPDLRGYGRSDQPAEVAAYSIPFLAGDVVAVMDAVGVGRAHVVGHDWGAALAWAFGSLLPDRVDHLVALSVGHPAAFMSAGYVQREKSWYMLLFQFEGIAEQWLSNDDWANLRGLGGPPRRRRGHRRSRAHQVAHARAQLLPGQRAARGPVDGASGAAPGAGQHDGGVEQRGLRPHRGPDDRIGRPRVGVVALRAHRGPRALDATRGGRCRQRAAPRLPARIGPFSPGPRGPTRPSSVRFVLMVLFVHERSDRFQAAEHLADVIDQARRQHEPVYLHRRGKRLAAVIDAEDLDRLIELAEDAIDIAEARAALEEEGGSIPWDEVKADLGL